METNAELDKWAAEKLKEAAQLTNENYVITLPDKKIIDFTLSDARCRSVFWEWYLNQKRAWYYSLEVGNVRGGKTFEVMKQFYHLHIGGGETIEEAEVACIQAIKDADGE